MFGKKKKRQNTSSFIKDLLSSDDNGCLPPSSLKPFDDNWKLYRPSTHVALKTWLPEPLDDAIRQIADHIHTSRSNLIREALFIYVYGIYAFTQMQAEGDGFFYDDGIRFSRSRNRTPQLGKNSINYKVWLPEALKNDLQTLANTANIKLSQFVRETLISHFMGHLTLPSREELLHQAASPPDDFEEDDSDEEK